MYNKLINKIRLSWGREQQTNNLLNPIPVDQYREFFIVDLCYKF